MFSIDARTKGRSGIDTSRDIFLRHEQLVGQSYSGLKDASFGALGCTFERCDFSKMRPRQIAFASGMEPSRYIECKFDGCRIKRTIPGPARFERCTFLDVEISGLLSHAAEFIDCTFSGKLRASVFYGRVAGYDRNVITRTENEFRGNDFSRMSFFDVAFRQGIDLSLQRLPTGENYVYLENAEQQLQRLREKYLREPPSERRREVFQFLEGSEHEVRDGQRQLLLCKDSEPLLTRQTVDAIWNELRQS
jgi:hypothetical protein